MKNFADNIAASMQQMLNDSNFTSMFSSSGVLEKLAFTRVADEDKPTEIEVELSEEFAKQDMSQEKSAGNPRGDCVNCFKPREGWTEEMGVCKCSALNGCNPVMGCKENCNCGCKVKKAKNNMNTLIKSAFDSLLKASSELEEAGFEDLSANALVLMNDLIVEAKKKSDKKDDKKEKAAKEKEKAEKLKAKERAEKDKNAAKDKALKEKAKLEKEKAALKKKKEEEKEKADKKKAKK